MIQIWELYFDEKYWDYIVKLSSLNHCAQVALLNSDFFKQKVMASIWNHKRNSLMEHQALTGK